MVVGANSLVNIPSTAPHMPVVPPAVAAHGTMSAGGNGGNGSVAASMVAVSTSSTGCPSNPTLPAAPGSNIPIDNNECGSAAKKYNEQHSCESNSSNKVYNFSYISDASSKV